MAAPRFISRVDWKLIPFADVDQYNCAWRTPHSLKPETIRRMKVSRILIHFLCLRNKERLPKELACEQCPVRLSVRTSGFQPEKRGSIPLRDAIVFLSIKNNDFRR